MTSRNIFAGLVGLVVGIAAMLAAVSVGQDSQPAPTLESLQARIVKLEARVATAEGQAASLNTWVSTIDQRSTNNSISVQALAPRYVDHESRLRLIEAEVDHDHAPALPIKKSGTSSRATGDDAVVFPDLEPGLYDLTIRSWTADAAAEYNQHFTIHCGDQRSSFQPLVADEGLARSGERTRTVQLRLHEGHSSAWTDRADGVIHCAAGDVTATGSITIGRADVSWEIAMAEASE